VLLVDTHCKDAGVPGPPRRPTLLDWLPVEWLIEICDRCRAADVRVALAGSLGLDEIAALRVAKPAWFAVRGAACDGGSRDGVVSAERVRALVRLIRGGD
jgi:uncharacterized protein (UPF0264 family)